MTALMDGLGGRNPRMLGRAVTYAFLDVRASVPGRCYVLDGEEVVAIQGPVPDWWWISEERTIALTVGLPGEGLLWTVFTCVANDDGTLFETVYVLGELLRTVARTRTVAEARAAHGSWLDVLSPQLTPNPSTP